jgi:hypothetical protein
MNGLRGRKTRHAARRKKGKIPASAQEKVASIRFFFMRGNAMA